MNPKVTGFFHAPSASITYVVAEPEGARCAIVDPVPDFDHGAARAARFRPSGCRLPRPREPRAE